MSPPGCYIYSLMTIRSPYEFGTIELRTICQQVVIIKDTMFSYFTKRVLNRLPRYTVAAIDTQPGSVSCPLRAVEEFYRLRLDILGFIFSRYGMNNEPFAFCTIVIQYSYMRISRLTSLHYNAALYAISATQYQIAGSPFARIINHLFARRVTSDQDDT